jgi:hypothetical protein
MTMQAVHEFYKAGQHNAQLIQNLLKDTGSPEEFIRNAVTEGNRQGYAFSYGEADQFIKSMQGAVAKKKSGGELSDLELEMVAGGKWDGNLMPESGQSWIHSNIGQPVGDAFYSAYNWASGAASSVGDWFSSW